MIAELIIFFILFLATAALIWSRRGRRPSNTGTLNNIEPRVFNGLFADEQAAAARELAQAEAELRAGQEREQLYRRAADGDRTALDAADARGDHDLYRQVLQLLIAQSGGDSAALRSTAGHIVDSRRLRATPEFAGRMIEIYGRSADQSALAEMIYLSALSDDATTFEQALRVGFRQWREGRWPHVSAADFQALAESAYWLITAEVRASGSGFMIKQVIANLRRELAAAS
jgi:hypothetical protein